MLFEVCQAGYVLALLVDGEDNARVTYAEWLRQVKFKGDEAEDGRVTLSEAISRPPSVIVTETQLPG